MRKEIWLFCVLSLCKALLYMENRPSDSCSIGRKIYFFFHKMHFLIYAVTDTSPQGSRWLITGLLDGLTGITCL